MTIDIHDFTDAPPVETARVMLARTAARLAEFSIARGMESEAALKRWRLFRAHRLHGEAVAYLDASQRLLLLARNI